MTGYDPTATHVWSMGEHTNLLRSNWTPIRNTVICH